MLEKHALYTVSNSDKWNQAFQVALECLTYENTIESISRIQQLYNIMQEWNAEYMGSIQLDSQIEKQLNLLNIS